MAPGFTQTVRLSHVINSTISGNTGAASSAGGIYLANVSAKAYLLNSIVVNNTDADNNYDINKSAGTVYSYYSWYANAPGRDNN